MNTHKRGVFGSSMRSFFPANLREWERRPFFLTLTRSEPATQQNHERKRSTSNVQRSTFNAEGNLSVERSALEVERSCTFSLLSNNAFFIGVLGLHALILDARPEIFHRFGHIPKAISLPREDFEACYSKQRTLLEKHKKHPVVIYCSGVSCEDGEMVANALIALGFTDVRFYRGGWDEWTRIGLPEEKAP